MKVAIVSARYLAQPALESFLGAVFGYGQAEVKVRTPLVRASSDPDVVQVDSWSFSVHYSESFDSSAYCLASDTAPADT